MKFSLLEWGFYWAEVELDDLKVLSTLDDDVSLSQDTK